MENLALIPVSNPAAGEAMRLAHEIREEEGVDMSEALSRAWSQIRDYDPYLDDLSDLDESENPEEDSMDDYIPKPRSRSTRSDEGTFGGLLLLAVAGLVIHRLASGQWFWDWVKTQQLKKRAIAQAESIALRARLAQAQSQNPPMPRTLGSYTEVYRPPADRPDAETVGLIGR